MRDRLIELLKQVDEYGDALNEYSEKADYLIGRGVIVLHCKVGDTVYQTDGTRIYELEVSDVSLNLKNYKPYYDTESIGFDADAIGKSIFLTREEAERALAERREG